MSKFMPETASKTNSSSMPRLLTPAMRIRPASLLIISPQVFRNLTNKRWQPEPLNVHNLEISSWIGWWKVQKKACMHTITVYFSFIGTRWKPKQPNCLRCSHSQIKSASLKFTKIRLSKQTILIHWVNCSVY